MQPAIHIKKTIDFNKGFRSLLEVMKLVAVSQYHILEKKLKHFEKLEDLMPEFFQSIDLNKIDHPFIHPGSRPMGVLAVTSDAGLLGGINMQVVSKAVELVNENKGRLIVVGDRGNIYAATMGMPCISFPGVQDDRRLAQAYEMRDFLIQKILSGEIGALKVVYPRAISFVVHRVDVANILPFAKARKDAAPDVPPEPVYVEKDLILESTPKDVVEYLVYLILGQRLYEIFGMSRLCEQAARFTHLEESCQKIQEMNQKLYLQYFRRRHEIIDANMRELFSARSLYAK